MLGVDKVVEVVDCVVVVVAAARYLQHRIAMRKYYDHEKHVIPMVVLLVIWTNAYGHTKRLVF